MTPQIFKTRITDLFGIDHPLVCGGLMWLADADYVSAVARAGGIGFITPRSFPTPEDFREQVRKSLIHFGSKFNKNYYYRVSSEPSSG